MNQFSIVLGILAAGGLAIVLWKMPLPFFFEKYWLKISLFALAAVTSLVLLLSLIVYRNFMRVSGIFLDHASRFIRSQSITAAYIPMMLLLAGALVALTIFELLAVWSQESPTFHKHKIFYEVTRKDLTLTLTAAVVLQFYLGLHFLRQACKLCLI